MNELDRAAALVLVPISPLEVHGPHLPAGTDLFLAEGLAASLARAVEDRWPELTAILYPPVPLGAHCVPGPGSVSVRQRVVQEAACDLLRSLSRLGFRRALLCNAHGGIGHIVALEEASEIAGREFGMRVESSLSRVVLPFLLGWYRGEIQRRLGRTLTAEERKALRSDIHGGQWETGGMLHLRPDLVGDYQSLPPVLMRSWRQLADCMTESHARGLGYVGAPALTSLDYYHAAAAVLQEKALQGVDRLLHAADFRPPHTPFYYLPGYRTRPVYDSEAVAGAAVTGFMAGVLVCSLLRSRHRAGDRTGE